jgi:hypothetical protein
VRRLLKRLWPGARGRGGVICHLRENGPIAYELALFGSEPRERADAMLSSEIAWTWRSDGRDWTHLSRVSLSAFLADLSAGRVLLLGTEGETPHDLANATVSDWLQRFCRTQPSPVAAVIALGGPRQLLFVQQHATDAVNQLLDAWGLDKGSAERRSYARLGAESLESLAQRLAR